MPNVFNNLYSIIKNIKNNIAFYPTVLAFVGFAFSLLMIILEEQGISKFLLDFAPVLVVENGDTALTILSVCISGLISMMVFSFSMVMLLLSQASSNFSPRLLPGLVSDKRNQVILGLYLSTIVYNIFTMFSIEPTGEEYTLPGFSVLLGILATMVCLGAFIYFIHNMSQSIQISMILDSIYDDAKVRLEKLIKAEKQHNIVTHHELDTASWHAYSFYKSGYFQNYSKRGIVDFCESHETQIYIVKSKGLFVLTNETFMLSKVKLSKEQLKDCYSSIYFSKNELVKENYNLAFKQITEIIVKAMSPGINDPGTALNGIDYLTELLAMRLHKKDSEFITNTKSAVQYGQVAVITFEVLLTSLMASLRTYCKHDPIVVQKLLVMLSYLQEQESEKVAYQITIQEQITILVNQAQAVFETEQDKELVKDMLKT